MRTRINVSYNQLSQVILCGDSFQAEVENHIEKQRQYRLRPERRWRRAESKKNGKFRR